MHSGGSDRIGARYAIVGAASALLLASCSVVLDADTPQCSSNHDCVIRGAAFEETTCVDSRCVKSPPVGTLSAVDAGSPEALLDPANPWRCAGHVNWAVEPNDAIVDHKIFLNFVDERAVAGLTVELCGRADVECASPLATVQTDATGVADIPITKGFAGYLQMKTPPALLPGLMPVIAPYVLPPGLDPTILAPPCAGCVPAGPTTSTMFVVTKSSAAALAAAVSTTLDPSRGLVFAVMGDCDNRIAAGVQFELEQADEKSARYYFEDGLPSAAPTETNDKGGAGFINVPPGIVTAKSRIAKTGQVIGSRSVLVRAGALTIFFFPPTPL